MVQFEGPWHRKSSVSSSFEVEEFHFTNISPLGHYKNWRVEKLEKISYIERCKGLQMVQFEGPRHWKPPVSTSFEVGGIPPTQY